MTGLIANELLKLRTTRGPLVLLVIELALVVVGVSGPAVQGMDPGDAGLARVMLAHAGLAALVTLVLGIGAFGTEYRHRTITDTYLSTPGRGRVVLAKLAAYGVAGLVFGVAGAATALTTAAAWASVGGVSLDLLGDATWLTLAGAVAWNGLFAVVGVGVGALLPNQASAIAAALAWIALVEGLVGALIGDMARWLPLASARALGYAPGDGLLPQLAGGLVLAAWAVLFAVLATAISARRDVA